MGMEFPETAWHCERVTASLCQADDSYRNVLAVGVRSEAAGGGFFVAPEQQRKGQRAMLYLIVFLGGGLGAALRHGVNLTSARILGTAFPYHTMFENVSGSFVMGLLAGYFAFRGSASQHWQLFFTTGILGGYTTFSAFSLDTALLYERSELGLAALYVLGSVGLAVGGLFAGLALARHYF
jgi:fluoride exporter